MLQITCDCISGICTAVKKHAIKAVGGDMAGDTCIFPFDFGSKTYYTCVEDNKVRLEYIEWPNPPLLIYFLHL